VPEQQFKLLQQSQQLVGLHQHMGASYGLSAAAIELAAQEGKAALVVGSVHLAAQLWSELADVQVRHRFLHNSLISTMTCAEHTILFIVAAGVALHTEVQLMICECC
jgi:hypothetical protein